MYDLKKVRIGVIGLGYVGLPLAIALGKNFKTMGFDVNPERIAQLENHYDNTLEVSADELANAKKLSYTNNLEDLRQCNTYIITVPTPIDKFKNPDLEPLKTATYSVAKILSKGDTVIYESTVYPGCTEEYCVPILEEFSSLKFNEDFYCGYSPERINPGDKKHRLTNIRKITSGSNTTAANFVDNIYKSIIEAGTHKAATIKIAEAAKVIENTQRDVNIALINELAQLFDQLEIDTEAVLEAAETKWNFLPFRPGLVGGHCIGVDPYYLTHKAREIGFYPEMITAGRRLNDQMVKYVSDKFIKKLINVGINFSDARILIMGLTFKENCPDLRNSKVFNVIEELSDFGIEIDVYDPWVESFEFDSELINVVKSICENTYDGVLVAVGHQTFREIGIEKIRSSTKRRGVVYDFKGIFSSEKVDLKM